MKKRTFTNYLFVSLMGLFLVGFSTHSFAQNDHAGHKHATEEAHKCAPGCKKACCATKAVKADAAHKCAPGSQKACCAAKAKADAHKCEAGCQKACCAGKASTKKACAPGCVKACCAAKAAGKGSVKKDAAVEMMEVNWKNPTKEQIEAVIGKKQKDFSEEDWKNAHDQVARHAKGSKIPGCTKACCTSAE